MVMMTMMMTMMFTDDKATEYHDVSDDHNYNDYKNKKQLLTFDILVERPCTKQLKTRLRGNGDGDDDDDDDDNDDDDEGRGYQTLSVINRRPFY